MRVVYILRRLVYFIVIAGGIVFLPFLAGKLDQKYKWLYMTPGSDMNLIWMSGFMMILVSAFVLAVLFFFFKWLITGKVIS